MYKKVLLPLGALTSYDRSVKALNKALEVCSGELIILHVTEPVAQVLGGEARIEVTKEEEAAGLMALGPILEQLEHSGAHYHVRIIPGLPAEVICRVATEENADLIIMYTDGRDELKDLFLGSITERVLRNTSKDLLAMRE